MGVPGHDNNSSCGRCPDLELYAAMQPSNVLLLLAACLPCGCQCTNLSLQVLAGGIGGIERSPSG